MIEIGEDACGHWTLTMISATGRVLVYREGFHTRRQAFLVAKAMRTAYLAHAARMDHRMAACF